MTAKHTPPPWEWDDDKLVHKVPRAFDIIVALAADTPRGAIVYVGNVADRPLLKAAPKLLQACRDVAAALVHHRHWKETMAEVLLRDLEEAIAEAETV